MGSVPQQIPITLRRITKKDMDDPNLDAINEVLDSHNKELLRLGGFFGTIKLSASVDVQGNSVLNVSTPSDATAAQNAAVPKATADETYGDAVVQSAVEVIGNNVLQSYRRLSDTTQTEGNSTYLNKILSTPPTSNASKVTFTVIDATHTEITVSASIGQRADGSFTAYAQRSDTVVNPTNVAIDTAVNSGAVRASGIVTLKFTSPHPFTEVGQFGVTAGITDGSFNTVFSVASIPDSTHITFNQSGVDATSGGGTASLGGVYYYYLPAGSQTLAVIGPFVADTPTNRLQANSDGQQYIAVAVVTSSGGSPSASGGGGDPGQLGCVLVGTPVSLHPGDREVEVNVVRCGSWVRLRTDGGKDIHMARGTLVTCFVEVENLIPGMKVKKGECGEWDTVSAVMQYQQEQYKEIRKVEPSHTYLAGGEDGIELHNLKTA